MNIEQAKSLGFHVEVNHFRLRYADFVAVKQFESKVRKSVDMIMDLDYDRVLGVLGIESKNQRDFNSENNLSPKDISPRGGKTEVVIEKDGKRSVGISNCYFTDNYNRETGRNLSLERAVKDFYAKIHI